MAENEFAPVTAGEMLKEEFGGNRAFTKSARAADPSEGFAH